MIEAKLVKLYCYGNPKLVSLQNHDWFSWIRFVDIVANTLPWVAIGTDWGDKLKEYSKGEFDDNSYYGYSYTLLNMATGEAITEFPGTLYKFPGTLYKRGLYDEISTAEIEDWRIETHQDLIPIATQVRRHLEQEQSRLSDIKRQLENLVNRL